MAPDVACLVFNPLGNEKTRICSTNVRSEWSYVTRWIIVQMRLEWRAYGMSMLDLFMYNIHTPYLRAATGSYPPPR